MGYSYNVVCDHGQSSCEPDEEICYEVICGTCGMRYGWHYGAEPAECPRPDGKREENEDARRYWTDAAVPLKGERGDYSGATKADMAAVSELLGYNVAHG